jgi:peptide-methionine (R)-S-oxide reductase
MNNENDMPKTEEEWKAKLTPEQYASLRQKGTEMPGSGRYLHEKRSGTYACAACGNPLFASDAKFDSATGWPSFDKAFPGAVKYVADESHGMHRTEVLCARCGSHLGHVFDDGPSETGKRYCMNSVCLDLKPEE